MRRTERPLMGRRWRRQGRMAREGDKAGPEAPRLVEDVAKLKMQKESVHVGDLHRQQRRATRVRRKAVEMRRQVRMKAKVVMRLTVSKMTKNKRKKAKKNRTSLMKKLRVRCNRPKKKK